MRSMCSTVLFSLTESRTSFHAPPCSLKTSFCGSVNRIAVSCQWMFIVLSCSIVVCCVRAVPCLFPHNLGVGADACCSECVVRRGGGSRNGGQSDRGREDESDETHGKTSPCLMGGFTNLHEPNLAPNDRSFQGGRGGSGEGENTDRHRGSSGVRAERDAAILRQLAAQRRSVGLRR